ncbi:MAG TPA: hypothetical protein VEW74_03280 [Candidatus Nitrosotalea sp.]|nr:hypothetical protein [Candidatus Nitrosotalea sp.]
MLFGRARGPNRHVIAVVRDVVEIVAILAAGAWAFYVFAYENRIKPATADPEVNVTSSMRRLSDRNGLIAVSLHLQLQNIGTVRAHLLGMAVNVNGERIVASNRHAAYKHAGNQYDFEGFYRRERPVPVYTYAYITRLGNPKTGQDIVLDPGTSIEDDRTFYVPNDRFDLLTVYIDAPYTKFDQVPIRSHLAVTPQGAASIVTADSSKIQRYRFSPASLDIR